jgi:hypothetical protein
MTNQSEWTEEKAEEFKDWLEYAQAYFKHYSNDTCPDSRCVNQFPLITRAQITDHDFGRKDVGRVVYHAERNMWGKIIIYHNPSFSTVGVMTPEHEKRDWHKRDIFKLTPPPEVAKLFAEQEEQALIDAVNDCACGNTEIETTEDGKGYHCPECGRSAPNLEAWNRGEDYHSLSDSELADLWHKNKRLIPCENCRDDEFYFDRHTGDVRIICNNCGLSTPENDTEGKAAKDWNFIMRSMRLMNETRAADKESKQEPGAEEVYKVGDEFEDKKGNKYRLVFCFGQDTNGGSGSVMMVKESGYPLESSLIVYDEHRISEVEFEGICGGNTGRFTRTRKAAENE